MKLKIGLDWDDTFAPFNSIAINMANEKMGFNPPLKLDDIDSWENTGKASVIKEFYNNPKLYELQSDRISNNNIQSVKELMKLAEVYFVSAVGPEFMTIRAKQIKKAFPDLPEDRILLGGAKHLVQLDVILDDNIHNVLNSPAQYPVLMRKPWNRNMTGLLSVNSFEEFVVLIKHILQKDIEKQKVEEPMVIALIGPTGAGKNQVASALCKEKGYQRVNVYTTNSSQHINHKFVEEEDWENMQGSLIESTIYAGNKYGIKETDITEILKKRSNVVIPLDVCGAIGIKKRFPTLIFYVNNKKEKIVEEIVTRDIPNSEKILRLLSIDAEIKNKEIADYVISVEDAVTTINGIIKED